MEAERDVVRHPRPGQPPSSEPPSPPVAGSDTTGPATALRAGLGHEREWVRFWAGLAGESE